MLLGEKCFRKTSYDGFGAANLLFLVDQIQIINKQMYKTHRYSVYNVNVNFIYSIEHFKTAKGLPNCFTVKINTEK